MGLLKASGRPPHALRIKAMKNAQAKPVWVSISRIVLKPQQLASLGAVVAESAYLEDMVGYLIGELTRMKKEQLDLFLAKAMLHAKIELLAEIGALRLKSRRRKERFAKIISDLKANNSERVTAVHGVWVPEYPHPINSLSQLMGPFADVSAKHPRGPKMSASKLDKLADKISAGQGELLEFATKAWLNHSTKRALLRARQRVAKALAKSAVLPAPQ
jgi:hypothetical protein